MARLLCMLALAGCVAGCANFEQFINALNERENLSSCIHYQGSMRIGGMTGGSVAIDGWTVTGQTTMDMCQAAK